MAVNCRIRMGFVAGAYGWVESYWTSPAALFTAKATAERLVVARIPLLGGDVNVAFISVSDEAIGGDSAVDWFQFDRQKRCMGADANSVTPWNGVLYQFTGRFGKDNLSYLSNHPLRGHAQGAITFPSGTPVFDPKYITASDNFVNFMKDPGNGMQIRVKDRSLGAFPITKIDRKQINNLGPFYIQYTSVAHGLGVGDKVLIGGLTGANKPYNGRREVIFVDGDDTWLVSDPAPAEVVKIQAGAYYNNPDPPPAVLVRGPQWRSIPAIWSYVQIEDGGRVRPTSRKTGAYRAVGKGHKHQRHATI